MSNIVDKCSIVTVKYWLLYLSVFFEIQKKTISIDFDSYTLWNTKDSFSHSINICKLFLLILEFKILRKSQPCTWAWVNTAKPLFSKLLKYHENIYRYFQNFQVYLMDCINCRNLHMTIKQRKYSPSHGSANKQCQTTLEGNRLQPSIATVSAPTTSMYTNSVNQILHNFIIYAAKSCTTKCYKCIAR